MISKYAIHNFKSHKDTELVLAPLTILTGMNGMGKSSVFQSMLLLRESFQYRSLPNELVLNGHQYDAGLSDGLNNRFAEADNNCMKLELQDEGAGYVCFEFEYPDTGKNTLLATENSYKEVRNLREVSLFSTDFQYLSAFRFGPVAHASGNTNVVDVQHQLSEYNGRGEYVAYYLHKCGMDNIPLKALLYEGSKDRTLQAQVDLWLNEISTGVRTRIQKDGDTYTIQFGYANPKKGKTEFFSAMNTGYGVSYILSVVVAVLSAKPGSLLLIENPESHIHPAGQSALMRLLAKAANNGVQIILETHSDHIVNGALVSAKKRLMSRNAMSFYFFAMDDDHCSYPIKVQMGRNGRLVHAPEDFFSQMKLDFETLYNL